jgi:hypothetical protein
MSGVREMRSGLYTPAGVVLLHEEESSDQRDFARGCAGVFIQLNYGSNRPLTEIMGEYKRALLASGYKWDPAYRIDETGTILTMIRRQYSTIEVADGAPQSKPLATAIPGASAYTTLYNVWLGYTIPNPSRCIG